MTVFTPAPNTSKILSTTTSRTPILTLVGPALAQSLWLAGICQRLLSTTTLFIFFRAYVLSLLLLRQSWFASQLLAIQSYYTSVLLSRQLFVATKLSVRLGWKATEKLRNKVFFEFMVFILGGGAPLLLIVFWPGWLFIGGILGSIWLVCG